MKKLNKVVDEKLTQFVDSASEITETIIDFVKRHRKLITVVVVLYIAFNWLFDED